MGVGIDVLVIIALIIAALFGFYAGFFKYILLWSGALVGFLLAPLISPLIVDLFSGTVGAKLLYGGVTVGLCVTIGMFTGGIFGKAINFLLPSFLKLFDRFLGALTAFVLIAALAWFILPLLQTVGGTAEEWRQESGIAGFFEDHLPDPPNGRIEDAIEKARKT